MSKNIRTLALGAAVYQRDRANNRMNQNWDDHNRSHRTVAQDLAVSMLESCEKMQYFYLRRQRHISVVVRRKFRIAAMPESFV